MGAKDRQCELELPATPAAVPKARKAASKFAVANGADTERVALAVSEAVANAVVHAYSAKQSGSVFVRAWVEKNEIRIAVRDQGPGLKPKAAGPTSGFGLPIIRLVTDALSVASTKLGVEVVMAFERHLRERDRKPD